MRRERAFAKEPLSRSHLDPSRKNRVRKKRSNDRTIDAPRSSSSKRYIVVSIPKCEPEITPKTNSFLFMAHFYAVLLLYLAAASYSPGSSITQLAAGFDNFWTNFISLGSILFVVALALHLLTCFTLKKLLSTSWFKPKLGNVGIREGYLTAEHLREALDEQKLRIGEILVRSGRVSTEQLNQTIKRQKKGSAPLGQILRDLGYATKEDIEWALSRMHRRLGEILREKGMLTTDDLAWLLGQQKFGPRRL
jgi:hypothetical protein